MMNKRWNILSADNSIVQTLQAELNINPTVCSMLVQRNILTYDDAKAYFRPQLSALHDPFLMKDMQLAVDRLTRAFTSNEKILVFGDYDVDGTTAVACMYQFLCKIYDPALVEFYIPHRYREGYGISRAGIDYAAVNNIGLIISLDCGIKSVELVSYAKSLGIDFIIGDHHLPDSILPDAVAILNPKQADCPYPYKDLCGCGVAFKLITALASTFDIPEQEYHIYLDLVATAIAADIVPMTGENRILTFFGLQQINTAPCMGIKALIKLGGVQTKLTINNVVFVIAPRVNAAGRMDDAKKAVQLFIEPDEAKAFKLGELLHGDNTDRKDKDASITAEALDVINNDAMMLKRKSTVVFAPHWHKGVVGIVASRLIEHHYRPTVVLTLNEGIVSGSARSVTGYNLYEAVHACREHLLAYGGHFAAAGLSLLPEKVTAFSEQFEAVVSSSIAQHLLIPEIIIDTSIRFTDITTTFYNIINQMEPFGPDNMRPVFIARSVNNTGFSCVLKEKHIRFDLIQHGKKMTGIGFNMAEKFPLLQQQKPIDIVFTLDENDWNGHTTLQLKVVDVRLSETNQ